MRIKVEVLSDNGTVIYQLVAPAGQDMEWVPFPSVRADSVNFHGLRIQSCTTPDGLPVAIREAVAVISQYDNLPVPDVEVEE